MNRLLYVLVGLLFTLFSAPLWAEDEVDISALKTKVDQSSGGSKIQALHDLSAAYRTLQDTQALNYGREALTLAEALDNPHILFECYDHLGRSLVDFSRYDEAINWFRKAEDLQELGLNQEENARLYHGLGLSYHLMANYSMAEFYLKKSLDLYLETDDRAAIAEVQNDLGNNYRYVANFDQAAIHLYQSLVYYESAGDSSNFVKVRENIAILAWLRDQMDRALELEMPNVRYYERNNDSVGLGFSYTVVGLIHYKLKDFDQSKRFALKSLKIRQDIGDVRGQGESWNNLALAYMGEENWDSAMIGLENALKYLTEGNDLRQIAVILGNQGKVLSRMGRPREALVHYHLAIGNAQKIGLATTLRSVYPKIAQTYADMGDYETALKFQQRYAKLQDSLYSEEQNAIIAELDQRYDSAKKDQELEVIKQKNRTNQILIYGLGGVFFLVIMVVYLVFSRVRLMHRQEQKLATTKLESAQLQLSEFTSNILKKNKLIEELEEKLEALELEDKKAMDQREAKRRELLQMKILTEEDWSAFKYHFEQVHTGFSSRLKEKFPELTIGESRLFILLKLHLSTREISNILGVSPDSVKKSRYRLRKKLQLKESEKLQNFVSSFE